MADPVAYADSFEQAIQKSKKLIGDQTDITAIYHVGNTDVITYRNENGNFEITFMVYKEDCHKNILLIVKDGEIIPNEKRFEIKGDFIYTSSYEPDHEGNGVTTRQ